MGVDVWMVTGFTLFISLKFRVFDVYVMYVGDNQITPEAIGDELEISVDRIIAGAFPGSFFESTFS
jgi:hypothetical protein